MAKEDAKAEGEAPAAAKGPEPEQAEYRSDGRHGQANSSPMWYSTYHRTSRTPNIIMNSASTDAALPKPSSIP